MKEPVATHRKRHHFLIHNTLRPSPSTFTIGTVQPSLVKPVGVEDSVFAPESPKMNEGRRVLRRLASSNNITGDDPKDFKNDPQMPSFQNDLEDSQVPFDPTCPMHDEALAGQAPVHMDPYEVKEPGQQGPPPAVQTEGDKSAPMPSNPKIDANVSDGVDAPQLSSEEKKRELARINSRKWHAEWISKGVPRGTSNEEPPAALNPAVAPSPAAAASPAVASSMAKVREKFITEWIEASGLPKSQDRFRLACKAWMESTTRAEIMSTRMGVQR
ncbi:unnamed protein product [Durusdinium trenchii]|uniref:Uncharacterized protein n=1 Tax=Durusdinium trenchii TaxID=1381693 RepID=A0ABP0IUA3_9DINO